MPLPAFTNNPERRYKRYNTRVFRLPDVRAAGGEAAFNALVNALVNEIRRNTKLAPPRRSELLWKANRVRAERKKTYARYQGQAAQAPRQATALLRATANQVRNERDMQNRLAALRWAQQMPSVPGRRR